LSILKGKPAVVTGSTSEIGLGCARAFAGAGANVVLKRGSRILGPTSFAAVFTRPRPLQKCSALRASAVNLCIGP
jgi:NAD(P)-dependent dehydrogenase (short-subunit alcohol dehydrogenase family)